MQGNMWNERFGLPGFAYGTGPNDFLVSVVDRIPRGKILSLGEGEGRNATFLASRGYDVVAVDSSEVGLDKCRRLADERGVRVTTILADLRDFTIAPESWNGIVSIFCHLPEGIRAPLHRMAVLGLKPGGAFVLEAYTPRQLEYGTGGPSTVERMVTLPVLRDELSGLDLIHALEKEREVREGSFHTGLAHVVQVVGVKRPIPAG
jgi:SAM-dependent methyltransferase